MKDKDLTDENNLERDDQVRTHEEGHPVATGVGALGGGAAGAAIGTAVGGPVGTVVGAVIGAVAGGAGGYAVGQAIDPAAEDAYWRENHYKQPFAKSGNFDQYQSGYKTGYEGYDRYGSEKRSFDEAESDLQRDYGKSETDLPWNEARDASRAAWTRAERGEATRVANPEGSADIEGRGFEGGSAKMGNESRTSPLNSPVNVEREQPAMDVGEIRRENTPDDSFGKRDVRASKEDAKIDKDDTF